MSKSVSLLFFTVDILMCVTVWSVALIGFSELGSGASMFNYTVLQAFTILFLYLVVGFMQASQYRGYKFQKYDKNGKVIY